MTNNASECGKKDTHTHSSLCTVARRSEWRGHPDGRRISGPLFVCSPDRPAQGGRNGGLCLSWATLLLHPPSLSSSLSSRTDDWSQHRCPGGLRGRHPAPLSLLLTATAFQCSVILRLDFRIPSAQRWARLPNSGILTRSEWNRLEFCTFDLHLRSFSGQC